MGSIGHVETGFVSDQTRSRHTTRIFFVTNRRPLQEGEAELEAKRKAGEVITTGMEIPEDAPYVDFHYYTEEDGVYLGVADVKNPEQYYLKSFDRTTRYTMDWQPMLRTFQVEPDMVWEDVVGPVAESPTLRQLRDTLQNSESPPLLYVHGYNTSFFESLASCAMLKDAIDDGRPVILFSWANWAGEFGYLNDNAQTDGASKWLHALLHSMHAWNDGRHCPDVILHSLGSYVFQRAVSELNENERYFGCVNFIASDVYYDVFMAADAKPDPKDWRRWVKRRLSGTLESPHRGALNRLRTMARRIQVFHHEADGALSSVCYGPMTNRLGYRPAPEGEYGNVFYYDAGEMLANDRNRGQLYGDLAWADELTEHCYHHYSTTLHRTIRRNLSSRKGLLNVAERR